MNKKKMSKVFAAAVMGFTIGGQHLSQAYASEVNTPPVLSARDAMIYVGDDFNPLDYATAYDAEDGDVTKNIFIHTNDVDTSKAGTYHVLYDVDDSEGEFGELVTTTVTVKEKEVVNTAPVVTAQDVTLYVGDSFNPLDYATAYDAEDGDITNNIFIRKNNVDTNKAGVYHVKYDAYDSKTEFAEIIETTVTVLEKVEENTAPVLTSREYIAVGINGWYDAMNGVKAIDEKDGDITNQVTIISNNVDLTKRGEYEILYSVTNSAGKVSTATTKVYTFGTPVIDASDITLQVGDEFDPMNGVHVSDLEDGDITSNLQVVYNGVDTSKAGTYQVLYTANDNGDVNANIPTGMGEKWITVTVVEKAVVNTAPVLTAQDVTLYVGDDFNPLDHATAYDAEDGDVTNRIFIHENDVDTSKAGTYHVLYDVDDSEGEFGELVRTTVTVLEKVEEEKPEVIEPTTPETGKEEEKGMIKEAVTEEMIVDRLQ